MFDLGLTYPQLSRDTAVMLGIVIVIALIFNMIPFLFYPFRRLATMIHELGHMIATKATGGTIERFKVFFVHENGARGYMDREGGDNLTVVPAGYVGVPLFGAILILLTGLPYHAPYFLIAIGIFLVSSTIIYGRSFSTTVIGLASGLLFIGVGWIGELAWAVFLLYLLAVQSSIIGLTSFDELANIVRTTPPDEASDDASKMAKLTGRSPIFWVRVWYFISIFLVGGALWFTWLRNLDQFM